MKNHIDASGSGNAFEPAWVAWRDLLPSVRALAPRIPRARTAAAVAPPTNAAIAALAAERARRAREAQVAAARERDGRAAAPGGAARSPFERGPCGAWLWCGRPWRLALHSSYFFGVSMFARVFHDFLV